MANFFIDRPIFAWVLAILLCLTGALAILSLPVEQYPDLAPPNVRITANYPGASAQTLENTVTQVIEQNMTGLDNLMYMSSQSSATGHLLGAAGGIEAIFTIQALRDQVVPPTLNLHHPDEDAAGMNLVALQARPQKMRYALSNGFGFGGVNASLLLKRWQ